MKKLLISMGGLVIVLVLVGQGCAQQVKEKLPAASAPTAKPAVAEPVDVDKEEADKTTEAVKPAEPKAAAEEADALTLTAKALGDGQVQLTWTAPADLDESHRFILVRDDKADPEHTGLNYWLRQHHSKREVVWMNNPTGTMYFRLCLTENDEKDKCVHYSDDAEVIVK